MLATDEGVAAIGAYTSNAPHMPLKHATRALRCQAFQTRLHLPECTSEYQPVSLVSLRARACRYIQWQTYVHVANYIIIRHGYKGLGGTITRPTVNDARLLLCNTRLKNLDKSGDTSGEEGGETSGLEGLGGALAGGGGAGGSGASGAGAGSLDDSLAVGAGHDGLAVGTGRGLAVSAGNGTCGDGRGHVARGRVTAHGVVTAHGGVSAHGGVATSGRVATSTANNGTGREGRTSSRGGLDRLGGVGLSNGEVVDSGERSELGVGNVLLDVKVGRGRDLRLGLVAGGSGKVGVLVEEEEDVTVGGVTGGGVGSSVLEGGGRVGGVEEGVVAVNGGSVELDTVDEPVEGLGVSGEVGADLLGVDKHSSVLLILSAAPTFHGYSPCHPRAGRWGRG